MQPCMANRYHETQHRAPVLIGRYDIQLDLARRRERGDIGDWGGDARQIWKASALYKIGALCGALAVLDEA